jgi:hypothetical protein
MNVKIGWEGIESFDIVFEIMNNSTIKQKRYCYKMRGAIL